MSGDLGTVILVALLGMTTTGAKYIHSGFKRRKQRELIEETPTAEVESVSIGPTELKGTVKPLDDVLEAPFTDEECLYCTWEVEEWQQTDDGNSWETIDAGTRYRSFLLDDGTGEIRVDTRSSAKWEVANGTFRCNVTADETPPEGIQQFLQRVDDVDAPGDPSLLDVGRQEGDRRYKQKLLKPGEEAYVYGAVRTDEEYETDLAVGPDTSRVDTEMFFIADQREERLLDDRDWTLVWRLPAGAAMVAIGIAGLYLFLF